MSVFSYALAQLRTRAGGTRASPSGKEPPEIVYGVDDVPPLYVVLLSGLQHVGLVTIFLIFPLLVLKEMGASSALSANILDLAIIALGVAALLQALPTGPVG